MLYKKYCVKCHFVNGYFKPDFGMPIGSNISELHKIPLPASIHLITVYSIPDKF